MIFGVNDWVFVFDFLKRIVNGFGVFVLFSGIRIGIVCFIFKLMIVLYFNIIKDEDLEVDNVNKFIDFIL